METWLRASREFSSMLETQGVGGILESYFVISLLIGVLGGQEAHDDQEDWKTEDAEEVTEHYCVL